MWSLGPVGGEEVAATSRVCTFRNWFRLRGMLGVTSLISKNTFFSVMGSPRGDFENLLSEKICISLYRVLVSTWSSKMGAVNFLGSETR